MLERKLPFFVEKPVAIDMATAQQGGRGSRQVRTAHLRRLHEPLPPIGPARSRHTPETETGPDARRLARRRPQNVRGHHGSGGCRRSKSGGQFLEQTTHTIDLARYLFGDVVSLYAVPVRQRRERPDFFTIEDASMVQLTFANGAAANLYSSCSTSVGGGVSLTVWGTDMKAEFTGWEHSVKISLPGNEQITIPGEQSIFGLEDRAFIDSIKAGADRGILANYEDGLKATAIACGANESFDTGHVVKL